MEYKTVKKLTTTQTLAEKLKKKTQRLANKRKKKKVGFTVVQSDESIKPGRDGLYRGYSIVPRAGIVLVQLVFEKVTIHYTKTIPAISHFFKERIEAYLYVHDHFNH